MNKAGEELHISSKNIELLSGYILYDISGRVMQKGTMGQSTIDVAQLAEGHYAITFDNGASVRFIKN